MLISSIMSFGINKILLTFSTTAAAVFGAYFKLYTFVSMATFGLNSALLSIVAYNLGTGKHDRIKKSIKLSGIYSALIGLVGLVLLQVFPAQIFKKDTKETIVAIWKVFETPVEKRHTDPKIPSQTCPNFHTPHVWQYR